MSEFNVRFRASLFLLFLLLLNVAATKASLWDRYYSGQFSTNGVALQPASTTISCNPFSPPVHYGAVRVHMSGLGYTNITGINLIGNDGANDVVLQNIATLPVEIGEVDTTNVVISANNITTIRLVVTTVEQVNGYAFVECYMDR